VEGPRSERVSRTLTPAVVGSSVFVAACALAAITFVAARGGLTMPVAATMPPVAVASQPATPPPGPSPVLTPAPVASVEPSVPAATPSPAPATAPPGTPAAPTDGPPSLDPNDPLLALPACPGLPGCFEYVVLRGDTLSGIASRYILPVSTVLALNPELIDPSTVVVGQLLYLGRDPMLRLDPCPDVPDCALYVVRPGDGLSTIAGRFGLTLEAILELNPEINDQNAIFSGQQIRLPRPA
jgi:hypothetical protein